MNEEQELNKDIINNVTINAQDVLDRLKEVREELKRDLELNRKLFNDMIHANKFDRSVAATYIKTIHNLIDTIGLLNDIKIRPVDKDSAEKK